MSMGLPAIMRYAAGFVAVRLANRDDIPAVLSALRGGSYRPRPQRILGLVNVKPLLHVAAPPNASEVAPRRTEARVVFTRRPPVSRYCAGT